MSNPQLSNVVLMNRSADAVSVGPGASKPYTVGVFSSFAPETNPQILAARRTGSGDTMTKFGVGAVGFEVSRSPGLSSMTITYQSTRADGAGPAGLYWTGYVGPASGSPDFGAATPTREADRAAAGWVLVESFDTPTASGTVDLSEEVVESIGAKVDAAAALATGPLYAFFVFVLKQLPGTRVYGSHPGWHLAAANSVQALAKGPVVAPAASPVSPSYQPLANVVLLTRHAEAVSVAPGVSKPYTVGRFSDFAPEVNPAFLAARETGSGDTMRRFGVGAIGFEVPRSPALASMTLKYRSMRVDGAGPAGLYWTGHVGAATGSPDFGVANPTSEAERVAGGWELVESFETPTDAGTVELSKAVVEAIAAQVQVRSERETGPLYAFFAFTLKQLPGTRVYGQHPDWHIVIPAP